VGDTAKEEEEAVTKRTIREFDRDLVQNCRTCEAFWLRTSSEWTGLARLLRPSPRLHELHACLPAQRDSDKAATMIGALLLLCSPLLIVSAQLRASLAFAPLIGGPRFLPVHIKVIVTDKDSSEKVVFDFIPRLLGQDLMRNNLNLLRGQDVDGEVRVRELDSLGVIHDSALKELCDEVLADYSQQRLNLYRNNCYHFAWRVIAKINRANT